MSRISGLEDIYATFASLPVAARAELKTRLQTIADRVVAAQKAAVPVDTGNLRNRLVAVERVESLKAKAGLTVPGKPNALGSAWYGIVVEYGRKPGEKLVQRRRRVNGKLRLKNRRKRLEDISSTYLVKWGALPARPFVHIDQQADAIIDSGLAGYWESVLANLP